MALFARFFSIWWGTLFISVLCLAILILSTIVIEPEGNSVIADAVRPLVTDKWYEGLLIEIGTLANNNAISASIIAFFTAAITTSTIYIFKIPEIRRISIQIIAAGYYENFLHGVIKKVYSDIGSVENSILIILPGYSLVESKKLYWDSFRSFAEKHGFVFSQETTDSDFGRNIFTIMRKDGEKIPIFLDMPTTLTNLKKIIELEEHSPVGTLRDVGSVKKRFYLLRDQFQEEIRQYVDEHDWGNVRFIEGKSVRKFEQEISDILAEIDQQPGAAS